MYQLYRRFGNNNVGQENLKLNDEYNSTNERSLSGLASLIFGLCFSPILSGDKLLLVFVL